MGIAGMEFYFYFRRLFLDLGVIFLGIQISGI